MWKLKIAEDGPRLLSGNNHVGRQHWEFEPEAGTPEERAQVEQMRADFTKNRFRRRHSSDLFMRMQLTKENRPPFPCEGRLLPAEAVKVEEGEEKTAEAVSHTLRRAITFYSSLQAHDGHWPAENAGPVLSLHPLVMVLYITGALDAIFSQQHQTEIRRYIYNHQNEDGGWGINIEGPSTMLGTAFSYITLRLLGEGTEDGEDNAMARAQRWILDHGSLLAIPTWGKFWLAVLGVYEWSGCNPVPPEFCLLPRMLPINPGKLMCGGRLVYMPMSYLYGKRFVGPITRLILALRQELYAEPYHEINWNKARSTIAKEDLYYPQPFGEDMVCGFLNHVVEPILMQWPFSILRENALKVALSHIQYEDVNSRYLCLACEVKVICMLTSWIEDPNSEAYKLHLARLPDYYWVAEDGLKIQLCGSQTWDAAFAIQAILSTDMSNEYGPTLKKAHDFIKASQVQNNPSGDFKSMYRHSSKGGWTFSIQDAGWQVSDCTAEGLKAAMLFSQMSQELVGDKLETARLYDAVNVILSLQSKNGGFSTWEPQRGLRWLEMFNPAEIFEASIVEKEYVECTSSALQSLALFRELHPTYCRKQIDYCIARATQYIQETQNPDGSWYGYWGICYTYATWFAVRGLAASGKTYSNSPTLRRACQFLLSKQLPCGGWGESYLSNQNKIYTNLEGDRPNLVQTAWALLSLIIAGQAEVDPTPIHRGIKVIINYQMEDGDFPQQEITGAFMRNFTLNYSSYRNIFPIWALGEYQKLLLHSN